jgi:hypothetical protein
MRLGLSPAIDVSDPSCPGPGHTSRHLEADRQKTLRCPGRGSDEKTRSLMKHPYFLISTICGDLEARVSGTATTTWGGPIIKRFVLCALSAGLLGGCLLAPSAMASTSTTNEAPYIVSVTGTIKGGFIETWADDSIVYVPTIGKQRRQCARSADDLSYCLGLVDGRMTEELALKVSLEHLQ